MSASSMAPMVIGSLTVVLLLLLGVTVVRRTRARSIAAIRARWGQPVERSRKMAAMAASHRSRVSNLGSAASLDDRTWEDLNLDDVFAALDRTESTLGQHALYHRLRTAPVASHLDAFEELVTRFGEESSVRERAQMALARLQDPHGYDLWWLARPDGIEIRGWYALFPVLTLITTGLLIVSAFRPETIPVLGAAIVANLVVRFLTDHRIGGMAAAFRQLAPVIATGQALEFLIDDNRQPLVGSLRSDARRLRRLKTIARWVSSDPLMLPVGSSSLTLLISDVANTIYEYLNVAFLLDANGVYFGGGELRARSADVLGVTAAIGEIDAAISVASVRAGRTGWTRPAFQPPGATAVFTDVCHPLIAIAVPNTITLQPGHGVLITGSNMSGKSTFLRTVGVATVMAQTLHTSFATNYRAPVLTVRSCIGRADDLLTGTSYYLAEVEALLALVEASGGASSHLFLFDELFRGTNAVERIAAGQAVLRELVEGPTRRKPHVVLAATHDGELVDMLADGYDSYHFTDTLDADGLVFDHRLQPGRGTTRNAIALLRLHGAPETLISRALACAAALDRQRGTTVVGR